MYVCKCVRTTYPRVSQQGGVAAYPLFAAKVELVVAVDCTDPDDALQLNTQPAPIGSQIVAVPAHGVVVVDKPRGVAAAHAGICARGGGA